MTSRFDGEVAVVTGAGRGIGRAHALLLASEGARVVVNDYGGDTKGHGGSAGPAEEVVAEIRAAGGTAVADSHDVAVDGAEVVATAIAAFGTVHAVVNNAGVANGGPIDELPAEDFDRLVDIHLGGAVAVCRAAWPVFRAQGYGRIVNTSSASVFGMPQTPAYVTAKAGLFGLTRALAHDGRKCGVMVNAIMPVAYSRLTAQSPQLAAMLSGTFPPEDIAPFTVALLTRDVPCTGETFVVGGGRAARVVLGTVPGATGITSVGEALARFDEVLGAEDIVVPQDAMHELRYECDQLGIDLASAGGDR